MSFSLWNRSGEMKNDCEKTFEIKWKELSCKWNLWNLLAQTEMKTKFSRQLDVKGVNFRRWTLILRCCIISYSCAFKMITAKGRKNFMNNLLFHYYEGKFLVGTVRTSISMLIFHVIFNLVLLQMTRTTSSNTQKSRQMSFLFSWRSLLCYISWCGRIWLRKKKTENITFSFLLQIKIKVVVAEEIISKVMNTKTVNFSLHGLQFFFLGGIRGKILIVKVRLWLGLIVQIFLEVSKTKMTKEKLKLSNWR